MFICNVKLNGKRIVKIGLIVLSIIVTIFFVLSVYRILNAGFKVRDEIEKPDIAYLTADEYTNVLRSVYDDVDTYIGQKICFSGYVYRCFDFSDTQFVLARDMIVNDNGKSFVVGFLCTHKDAKNFSDGSWVQIIGEITKGNYHGDIPIIKVTDIQTIEKPVDEYVCPPDETYIPTSVIY